MGHLQNIQSFETSVETRTLQSCDGQSIATFPERSAENHRRRCHRYWLQPFSKRQPHSTLILQHVVVIEHTKMHEGHVILISYAKQ